MSNPTPIYGLLRPLVDSEIDRNQWGTKGNTNQSILENALKYMRNGECRLSWNSSTGNLELRPYNGNVIIIDSVPVTIPDAGVVLPATGAAIDTNYFIYAYLNSGTLTLEYSTTTYAVEAGTGIVIKTGDSSRTLVGYARTVTGPAWIDDTDKRFVLSWFNRRPKGIVKVLSSVINVTSTTPVELSTELRGEFLTFGAGVDSTVEDDVICAANFCSSNTTAFAINYYRLSIDDPTGKIPGGGVRVSAVNGGGGFYSPSISPVTISPAQGYHYVTVSTFVSQGNNLIQGSSTSVAGEVTDDNVVKITVWG